MNSSPSPEPDQITDAAASDNVEKTTHSQRDMPTGTVMDQSVYPSLITIDVGATLSSYKIIQKLGEGGMGAVFVAEDVALRRKVALKTMKPELAAKETSKQRFFREARAAARIEHDNIVPIYQVGEDRGVPFMAMALLKGESLGDHLKRHPRPDVQFVLKVGRDVAAGLAAAHEEGLIHRDIKPDNVWIEPLRDGSGIRAKILDFGLARPQDEEQSLVTQEGAILGTPAYMAPEQARGRQVDARADLFSLGVMLYQMATGKRPFTGRDTMAILTSLAIDTPAEPITLNPALPPILSKLIMRLLEKDLQKRVQKASDVVDVLKRLQPEATVVVVATPLPAEANPWADIDTSMTAIEPPPPPLAASRPQPVKVVHRDQTEVVSRDAASGKTNQVSPTRKRGIPLLIGGALAIAGIIVAAILIFGNKNNDPPADTKNQQVKKEEPPKRKSPPIAIPVPPVEGNYALVLDGKKFELPVSLELSRPFTVEAYVTKHGAGGYPILIPTKFFLQSGPNWTFKLMGLKGVPTNSISTPAEDSMRHHLACVFNGKEMHLFVDGSKKATKNIEDDLPKPTVSSFELGYGYKGQIDEIRISHLARYERDFAPQARFTTDKDTVALYHCDEAQGEELKDSSGNNYHGKIVGAKWVKVGESSVVPPTVARHALEFSAANQRGEEKVTIPKMLETNAPFTVEMVATPRTIAGDVESRPLFYSLHWFEIKQYAKSWNFVYSTDKGKLTYTRAYNVLKAGERTHLTAVFDGTEMRFFVNGKLVDKAPVVGESMNQGKSFAVGGPQNAVGTNFSPFDGTIEQVRISNKARYTVDYVPPERFTNDDDTKALYLFEEGEGNELKDSSGNNHHGKIVGAKWVKVATPPPAEPKTTFALDFDGIKSAVALPNVWYDGSTPLTLEAWATPSSVESTRKLNTYVIADVDAGGLGIVLGKDHKWDIDANGFGHKHTMQIATDERPDAAARMTHLALVRDGTSLRLFVDGKLCLDAKATKAYKSSVSPFYIGAQPAGTSFTDLFRGLIHAVRLSKSARYDKNFVPKNRFEADKDTLAVYHFDEGQGDELKDSSGNGHHGKIVGAKWVKLGGAIPQASGPSPYDVIDPAKLASNPAMPWRPKELIATAGVQHLDSWRRYVTKVHLSSDGKTLFASSQDGTITVRDAEDGKVRRVFEHQCYGTSWPYSSAPFEVSPDDRWLVYRKFRELIVWDLKEQKEVKTWPSDAKDIAFSPDGKWLVDPSGLTLRIMESAADWKLKQEIVIATREEYRPTSVSIAVSRDSKVVAVRLDTTGKRRIRTFNISNGERVGDFQPERNSDRITFGATSDELYFVGMTDGHFIVRFDLKTGAVAMEKPYPNSQGVALSPDGRQLLVGKFGSIASLKPDDLSQTWGKGIGFGECKAVAFSANGERVAVADSNGALSVRNAQTGDPVGSWVSKPNFNRLYALSDGRALATGSNFDHCFFDFKTGKETFAPKIAGMSSAAPTFDHRQLIVALPKENRLAIVDLDSNAVVRDLNIGIPVMNTMPIDDGRKLLLRTSNSIGIADFQTGVVEKEIQTPGEPIAGIAVDPAGRRAVLTRRDGKVELFDLQMGKLERTFETIGTPTTVRPAISRDGQWLACGQTNTEFAWGPTKGAVRLWAVATGNEQTLELPKDVRPGYAVDISPDGEELASGGFDGQVHLWEIKTGKFRRSIRVGPENGVIWAVTFAPDGRHLLVGNSNGTASLLRLAETGSPKP